MAYYNSSTRNHFHEPPSVFARVVPISVRRLLERRGYQNVGGEVGRRRIGRLSSWVNLPHALVLVWWVVLLWGERWVFQSAVEECRWEQWERWPKDATPHHLILLADPQLIDPHSYPERPWPLDTFTMWHTDNYMKRSYISLQKKLHPDTIFFLGDLFDGGREWKTAHGNTIDPSWANGLRPSGEQKYVDTWGKRYGEDFWLHEYNRFGKIFYRYWDLAGAEAGPGQRGRRIISSLPGNHDLGFGAQIKIPVRNRFEVYFGEGNRVDVIANHTFVSIDSVSLSAGSDEHGTPEITKPVEDFLNGVKVTARKAVADELSRFKGEERTISQIHKVEDLGKADFSKIPKMDPGPNAPELPTILLTHVPLYRQPGEPCGPKREHWPPAPREKGSNEAVFPDHKNAISISKGYQYQNVLSEADSVKVIESIGNVNQVFSGDDHDYCEIIHTPNKNSAREITIKAFSWAMGVRKPGFLMLSMWNPIDGNGKPLHSSHSGHGSGAGSQTLTNETHLCLLPDQIGILIRYGILVGISVLALLIKAILTPILHLTPFSPPPSPSSSSSKDNFSLLPISKPTRRRETSPGETRTANSSTSSTASSKLAPRTAARTRSVSPAKGYGLPASQVRFATPPAGYHTGLYTPPSEEEGNGKEGKRRVLTPLEKIWREWWTSVWRVLWVVVGIYLWLVKFYPT